MAFVITIAQINLGSAAQHTAWGMSEFELNIRNFPNASDFLRKSGLTPQRPDNMWFDAIALSPRCMDVHEIVIPSDSINLAHIKRQCPRMETTMP